LRPLKRKTPQFAAFFSMSGNRANSFGVRLGAALRSGTGLRAVRLRQRQADLRLFPGFDGLAVADHSADYFLYRLPLLESCRAAGKNGLSADQLRQMRAHIGQWNPCRPGNFRVSPFAVIGKVFENFFHAFELVSRFEKNGRSFADHPNLEESLSGSRIWLLSRSLGTHSSGLIENVYMPKYLCNPA
jgi:hypothetical protein